VAEYSKTDRIPFTGLLCGMLKEDFPERDFFPERIALRGDGITVSCEGSGMESRYLDGGYRLRVDFCMWTSAKEDSAAARKEAVTLLSEIAEYLEDNTLSLPEGFSSGVFELKQAPILKKRNTLGEELYAVTVSMRFTRM